jgi:SAM-dependent methyltransferase
MSPRIPPSKIGDYYPKTYYTNVRLDPGITAVGRALFNSVARSRGYKVDREEGLLLRLLAWLALPYSQRYIVPSKIIDPVENGSVLDVGCGNGANLTRYKSLGWKTFGQDISPDSCEVAREAGHEIFTGDLFAARYPDEAFDAVTMWDSLEHIPNPADVMKEVRRIMRPGGKIYISVPNFGSRYGKDYKDKWYMFTSPVHYYHYDRTTLSYLLTHQGFRNIEISFPLGGAGIHHTLLIANRENPGKLRFLKSSMGYRLYGIIDRFAPGGHLDAKAIRS